MRQWTVDAFASEPFKGNPACVVEAFDSWPGDGWMQALASENNQAETAFLLRTSDPGRYGLRWFTPGKEVPLCGHATLASAHVLFTELGAKADRIAFETRSAGVLTVGRSGSGYEMDFPANAPRQIDMTDDLAQALGAPPVEAWVGQYLIAVMADEATVRGLRPDIAKVAKAGAAADGGPGQIVAVALAEPRQPYQVVSRFFAPGCGVPEDPTTGSAHCILAPLYAKRLGRRVIDFHQAYPGRGGDLQCEMSGDRVLMRGAAVTVMEAVLRL